MDLRQGPSTVPASLRLTEPQPEPVPLGRGPRVQLRHARCGRGLGKLAEDTQGGLQLVGIAKVSEAGAVDLTYRADGLHSPRRAPRYVFVDGEAGWRRRSSRSWLPLPWVREAHGFNVGLTDAMAFGCRCGEDIRVSRSGLVTAFDAVAEAAAIWVSPGQAVPY